jgi:hypothetical protein
LIEVLTALWTTRTDGATDGDQGGAASARFRVALHLRKKASKYKMEAATI